MTPRVESVELRLLSLRSCLVNLPARMVSSLQELDTPVQDIVVELRDSTGSALVYAGWTGFASHAAADQRSIRPSGASNGVVEIDSTWAEANGLQQGQRVHVALRECRTAANVVYIEPQTAADWEMIEMNASFLETNAQSQIRVVPNPEVRASASSGVDRVKAMILILHLSPVSSVRAQVSSLEPQPSTHEPFVKLSVGAELVVQPKMRSPINPQPLKTTDTQTPVAHTSQSRTSMGMLPATASANGARSRLLRGIDLDSWRSPGLENHSLQKNRFELSVAVSRETFTDSALRDSAFVAVSTIPVLHAERAGDRLPADDRARQGHGPPSLSREVSATFKLEPDLTASDQALLSSELLIALGQPDLSTCLIRIEATNLPLAPKQVHALTLQPLRALQNALPYRQPANEHPEWNRDVASRIFKSLCRSPDSLYSPLTDGMLIASEVDADHGLETFKLGIEPSETIATLAWLSPHVKYPEMTVSMGEPIVRAPTHVRPSESYALPVGRSDPIAMEHVRDATVQQLRRGSSVLLVGAAGSGCTTIAVSVARTLQRQHTFMVSFVDCALLNAGAGSLQAARNALDRAFVAAGWGRAYGEPSLLILDNLDKLCPAENELQVGQENGRSLLLSKHLCSAQIQAAQSRRHCVVLAIAKSAANVQNLLLNGRFTTDTIQVKSPNKAQRQEMLDYLLHRRHRELMKKVDGRAPDPDPDTKKPNGDPGKSEVSSRDASSIMPFSVADLATRTDGFLAGDLNLLLERAEIEAHIRVLSSAEVSSQPQLEKVDLDQALSDFVPASLRNVALNRSTVSFESVGGLRRARALLLETLQYPTTYAPLFSQCSLRLRSGILLYGYPGCGKTLLARAVAGSSGLNFISVKGPEILNKYIGASEKSVRDLFDRAEAAKPCILFFDEFDSIAPKRGHDSTGVTDRVVNQLLTQLDGAEGLDGVYVLAATSRPDLIDSALLRPGRLDKSVLCDMPSIADREDILRTVSTEVHLEPSISQEDPQAPQSLAELARRTDGFTGADLQALIYNAMLESIQEVLASDRKVPATPANGSRQVQSSNEDLTSLSQSLRFRFGEAQQLAGKRNGDIAQRRIMGNNSVEARTAQEKALFQQAPIAPAHNVGSDSSRNIPKASTAIPEAADQVVVRWKHLEASLQTTRPSLSQMEKQRLEAIYQTFTQGRLGDYPNGQAPNEIGGRSSLM